MGVLLIDLEDPASSLCKGLEFFYFYVFFKSVVKTNDIEMVSCN